MGETTEGAREHARVKRLLTGKKKVGVVLLREGGEVVFTRCL